ncbi:MAG TPA: monovalent cation/H+ antiporter complex subunit F [Marmoricola sp.]|jgi:multisubunit Na+/H+ antiporter MnhF subunit
MRELALWAAVGELLVSVPLLVRLARGPSVCDRVIAVNTWSLQVTLALLFFSFWAQRTIYLDVAIWSASFSYLGTLVWARLLERELL